MPKISAVIVDTYSNKKFAATAIKIVQSLPFISEIFTFSDKPFTECLNVNYIKIEPIKSNNQYSQIILQNLPPIIKDSHVLVFQWDGFPVNINSWLPNFLDYDYIGAPCDEVGWVGNGGFSLRSRKLLEKISELKIAIDLENPFDQPEDVILCRHKKTLLEEHGVLFAPRELATKFSHEAGPVNKKAFGFHRADNFPFFIRESELIRFANDIVPRIGSPWTMCAYLENCYKENMNDL